MGQADGTGVTGLSVEALDRLYGQPAETATAKVVSRLTPEYARWIGAARFCVLSTVGPEGTDGSPRGDDGPVVTVLDPGRLALPDWHGNRRIDSLRNIARDGRLSLMFLVPGSANALRVNGRGIVTDDTDLRSSFARDGRLPRTVVVIGIAEVYFQCARAVMRAGLWARDDAAGLPTPGEMLAGASDGRVGGADYDRAWPARAAGEMW